MTTSDRLLNLAKIQRQLLIDNELGLASFNVDIRADDLTTTELLVKELPIIFSILDLPAPIHFNTNNLTSESFLPTGNLINLQMNYQDVSHVIKVEVCFNQIPVWIGTIPTNINALTDEHVARLDFISNVYKNHGKLTKDMFGSLKHNLLAGMHTAYFPVEEKSFIFDNNKYWGKDYITFIREYIYFLLNSSIAIIAVKNKKQISLSDEKINNFINSVLEKIDNSRTIAIDITPEKQKDEEWIVFKVSDGKNEVIMKKTFDQTT